jgi:hypothetical protein
MEALDMESEGPSSPPLERQPRRLAHMEVDRYNRPSNSPKGFQILSPWNLVIGYLIWQKEFAGRIKSSIFRWGSYLGLCD